MERANTIEQFKIMLFLQKNFDIRSIDIQLLDRYNIKIMDANGDTLTFTYNKNGEITYK